MRSKKVLIDISYLVAFRVGAIAIGLLYIKIYTGRLETESLGIFFYLTTLSYLLNAILFVPFDYYLQAYCARAVERLPFRPLAVMTAGVLAAALLLVAALGGVLVALGQLSATDIIILYLMAVLLFACTSVRNLLNNRGHRRIAAASLLIEAIGRILAFLTLLLAFTPSGRVLFASAAAALAVELVILAGFAAVRLPWSRSAVPPEVPTLLATTPPISVSAACNLIQLQGYRTLYPWAGITTTPAVFAVVANIGTAGMMAAGQVFAQVFLPRVYQSGGDFIGRYVQLASLLIIAVAAFAWAISPWLVPFMTSAVYGAYAGLIVFGVVMEGANVITGAIAARAMLMGDTRHLMTWNIAGAAVAASGYGLALVLAPQNPLAIGISLLLSQVVVVGGLIAGLRRPPRSTPSSTSIERPVP